MVVGQEEARSDVLSGIRHEGMSLRVGKGSGNEETI